MVLCWSAAASVHCRGVQGGFLMLSPLLMSISPEVLLHFQISLVQQYPLCLNGHDLEKSSAGV